VLGSEGSYAAEGERVLYFIQTHFRYVKFRMGVPVGDSVNRRGLEWCDEEKPLTVGLFWELLHRAKTR